jgi:hypothetical protein
MYEILRPSSCRKSNDKNRIITVRSNKKRYVFSKSLLYYYSKTFENQLAGKVALHTIEGWSRPAIDLANDKTEDWEVLYEFMIKGGFHDGPLNAPEEVGKLFSNAWTF